MPHLLIAQQSQIRFVAFTVLAFSKASVTYEYSINEKHSLGVEMYAYFAISPDWFTNYARGFRINYRFYPGLTMPNTDDLIFIQGDVGYYFLHDEMFDSYTSNHSGIGLLFGIRNMFGHSKHWFVEFAFGGSADYRIFKSYIDTSYPDEREIYTLDKKPSDSFVFTPRLVLEIGVKF